MAKIALSKIRLDGGTQPRAGLDDGVVEEYAEAMRAGARFPDVVLYFDGSVYWLADGFHRWNAAMRLGRRSIGAEVRQGTRREAILHSVGANAEHGLRRSNTDKRRAVETLLRDAEWAKWSDAEIARRCAVTDRYVAKIRAELSPNSSGIGPRTVQRGGTIYTLRPGGGASSSKVVNAPNPAGSDEDGSSLGGEDREEELGENLDDGVQPTFAVPDQPSDAPSGEEEAGDADDDALFDAIWAQMQASARAEEPHPALQALLRQLQYPGPWRNHLPPALQEALAAWEAAACPGLPADEAAGSSAGDPPASSQECPVCHHAAPYREPAPEEAEGFFLDHDDGPGEPCPASGLSPMQARDFATAEQRLRSGEQLAPVAIPGQTFESRCFLCEVNQPLPLPGSNGPSVFDVPYPEHLDAETGRRCHGSGMTRGQQTRQVLGRDEHAERVARAARQASESAHA